MTIQQRNMFKRFIVALTIKHINTAISKTADDFINKNINSKPADTFIGATAKHYNLFLVTTNDKDFKNFELIIIKVKH